MKNTIGLFCLLLFVGANAQDTLSQMAVIAADKMNVLYVGIENPISVAIPGCKSENIMLVGDGNCDIVKKSSGHYIVRVKARIDNIIIATAAKDEISGNMVAKGKVDFKVRELPKPFPMFGNITGANAKARQIANMNVVNCGLPHEFSIQGLNYTVTRYSMVISPKDSLKSKKVFVGILGNKVTSEIKLALSTLVSGDLISIYNIEALGPDRVGLVKLYSSIVIAVE